MDQIVGEVFGRAIGGLIGMAIDAAANSSRNKHDANHPRSSIHAHSRTLDVPPSNQHERAVLTASSTITFGNDCERLVNIAFRTSQSFPSMMGTYADVSQYLRKELTKQYPNEYFHIIIGKNHAFGFSVDESQYYAEIQQDRYRIIIFSTKQNLNIKSDIHDADSQMSFKWN